MPTWNPANLTQHHQKRTTTDKGCFEDLMKINGRDMTQAEYEQRSQDAVANSWAEYEGEGRDVARMNYYPRAAYFVDDDLVIAISDLPRIEFRTCFHQHFGNGRHGSGPNLATSAQRRLHYNQHLTNAIRGRMLINVRRIR
jgi:hypothetical protein